MTALVKRVWLPVLIVVAVVIGAATVSQLREAFGADPVLVTPTGNNTAESFNPKVVTYEVFGSGSTGVINYVDLDGIPQRVENAALPWSLTLSTTVPAVSANILALLVLSPPHAAYSCSLLFLDSADAPNVSLRLAVLYRRVSRLTGTPL